VSALSTFLDDYAARHPEWDRDAARRKADEFFASIDDSVDLNPAPWSECDQEHGAGPAGPNEDLGQCHKCWMPVGVLRPDGESFGWHRDDCSLPMRHRGYCQPGGAGHVRPEGWKIRG
jgi:hypothetical protein